MPGITNPALIPDMLEATLEALPEADISDAVTYNTYAFNDYLLANMPKQTGGAVGARYDFNVGTGELSRGVGMYEVDNFSMRPGVLRHCVAPWVILTDEILYDISELARNAGGAEVANTLDERRTDMLKRAADTTEVYASGVPDSATDLKRWRGAPYWARKLRVGQEDPVGGFNGTHVTFRDGSETADMDGQDRSIVANSRMRNWNFTHGGVVDRTLMRAMILALIRTKWKSPRNKQGINRNGTSKVACFMGTDLYIQFGEWISAGPDNRNGNAMPFYDNLKFGPADLVHAQVLDEDPDMPLYGLDWKTIHLKALTGRWNSQFPWRPSANASNVMVKKTDWEATAYCKNPRNNFVGHLKR
ncbi:MAG TPA: hypothetical protein VFF65_09265 [Phycisphaerales bacterium]|nr:hypothetical protein [Phycisphaerales bacterium]